MNVLVAPDSFKGSISSIQFIRAVEDVAARLGPDVNVTGLPMADGGEGTLDVLEAVLGGERQTCVVEDPLGRPVSATYLVRDGTAFVEMAQSTGLTLLRSTERNPLRTSSFGLGQVLVDALNHPKVENIFVGIGGSATNDGGIGMAQALGLRVLDSNGHEVRRGGAHIGEMVTLDTSEMHPQLKTVPITVMSDVQSPLFGPFGASRLYGPQRVPCRGTFNCSTTACATWRS